jgi:biopolymer transport protein TolQ
LTAEMFDVLSGPFAAAGTQGVVPLILHSGPLVQLVLLLLLILSVASWGIIAFKSRQFRRAANESALVWSRMRDPRARLSDLRDGVESFSDAPEAVLVKAGFVELTRVGRPAGTGADLGFVATALERAATREVLRLERHLTLLATTGSSAPFIGLFGTVWGILNTFRSLGASGSTSLTVVAPGIAEALVATAAGLAAAIPAVMAYNHYLQRIRVVEADMETFASEFLDRLRRAEG